MISIPYCMHSHLVACQQRIYATVTDLLSRVTKNLTQVCHGHVQYHKTKHFALLFYIYNTLRPPNKNHQWRKKPLRLQRTHGFKIQFFFNQVEEKDPLFLTLNLSDGKKDPL
jgi:hypothetical protein